MRSGKKAKKKDKGLGTCYMSTKYNVYCAHTGPHPKVVAKLPGADQK